MPVPNNFVPTTTIESQKVDDNFSYLERDITILDGTLDTTIATGVESTISEMTTNIAVTSGDILHVRFQMIVTADTAGDIMSIRIRENTTTLNLTSIYFTDVSRTGGNMINLSRFYTVPSTGTRTYDVQWARIGSGTIYNRAANASFNDFEKRQFSVEVVKN